MSICKSKKVFSAFLITMICLISTFSTTVFAANPLNEYEFEGSELYNNNEYTGAQLIFASSLLDKTYPYVQGSFYGPKDTADHYKFSLGKSSGSNGRIAIKLEGIPTGHDYEIYLLDQNGNEITRSSISKKNSNRIIKTPPITTSTNYYIKIEPIDIPDYSNSSYRIIFDTHIVAGTKTADLLPNTLNSTNNVWSPYANVNLSSLPNGSIVTNATIQANKSFVNNTYNNQLRVKSLKNNKDEVVNWKAGAITVPNLVNSSANELG